MGWSRLPVCLVCVGVLLLSACGSTQPEPAYLPVPDGGVALILRSPSTNTRAVTVVVYPDGSGVRTVGEDGGYWVYGANGPEADQPTVLPARFPPHTPDLDAFLSDLAQVDDVADLTPSSPCAMSISFGTTLVLSADHHTSGNIDCAAPDSDDEQAVVDDCQRLTRPPPSR